MRRILVTGSRNWTDAAAIHAALSEHASPGDTLVHGACPDGADPIAAAYWRSRGPMEPHPAKWRTYGRSAGPIRNAEMVALGADVMLAFPLGESRGTRGCIAMAQDAGITVHVFER